jgi:hypothetical protein
MCGKLLSHIRSDDHGLSPYQGAVTGTHFHLFRRGNVFYWRRRVPGFSTENGMIQLSLRTGTRRYTHILARKLTAKIDRIYDKMSRNLVSVQDARAFLSHVINDALARMRRVALVTCMDPVGSFDDDRRADWATAQARKLMANYGPRAEISDTGRSIDAATVTRNWKRSCPLGHGKAAPRHCQAFHSDYPRP